MDCENPIPSSPNSNCHNTLLGVAAPRLIVDFTLPFDSFAPSSVETVFKISTSEGTKFETHKFTLILYSGSICIFIPEHSPSHNVQKAAFLSQEAYDRAKASQTGFQKEIFILEPEKWREISSRANGWVDVAAFNHLSFNFEYKWHYDYRPRKVNTSSRGIKFDPALSEPDCLKVGIKAVNIEAIAYPTLIPCLLNFKENIFGYWDDYTSFAQDTSPLDDKNLNDADDGWKTPFRPFSVIVDVEVSDIVARLPFAPNYKLPTGGPLVKLNTIWFELDKHYQETRMQLIISDLDLTFDHIHSGVKFSGLQYRGFAFFSAEGCKNIDLPLEYAWMQEIEVGKLSGDAPLDFLVNLFLWIDQVVIILDDFASKYEQPRELIIGDEMKFEKVQVGFIFLYSHRVTKDSRKKF